MNITRVRSLYSDTQSNRYIHSRRIRSFHVPYHQAGGGIDIIGGGNQDLEFTSHREYLGRGDAHSPARDINSYAHALKTILADIDQQAFVYSFVLSFCHGYTRNKIGKRSQSENNKQIACQPMSKAASSQIIRSVGAGALHSLHLTLAPLAGRPVQQKVWQIKWVNCLQLKQIIHNVIFFIVDKKEK